MHEPLWWALIALALALLWWHWHRRLPGWSYGPGLLLLALIGYLNAAAALAVPLAAPLRAHATELAPEVGKATPLLRLEGRVVSFPKFQSGHLRLLLDVSRVRELGPKPEPGVEPEPGSIPRWQSVRGKAMLYLKCEAAPEVDYGDVIRLSGSLAEELPARNLGQFDYRRYLLQHGTVITGYAPSAKSLDVRVRNTRPPWPQLSALRRKLTGELTAALPADQSQLAISVVYGDKVTELDDTMRERFRQAGLSHILVASGTQVSLLIALMLSLGWRRSRWLSTAARVLLAFGIIFVYSVLAGLETSIIRALVMGCVVLATRLLQREGDGLSALSQAALILLLANPLQVSSAGFLLSFMATFGLIYFNGITLPWLASVRGEHDPGLAPPPQPGLRGWVERQRWRFVTSLPTLRLWLLAGLSTTIGAQLFVIPVLASQFSQLSLWGFVSNAVAVPLSFTLLLFGALLSFGLGGIPVLGDGLTALVSWNCWALDEWAALFARLPGSDLALPPPAWWQVLLAYALLLVIGEWVKLRQADDPAAVPALVPASVTAMLLVLLASLLHWLIVPRPELAALALPGGEAYFWRARDGSAWVIARRAGLSRSRNDETLQAAIRYRGCNRVRGVFWTDDLPQPEEMAKLPGPDYVVGTAFERAAELCAPTWINDVRGQPVGASVPVGGRNCAVLWDGEEDLSSLSYLAALQPDVTFLPARLARDIDLDALSSTIASGLIAVVDGRRTELEPVTDPELQYLVYSGSELRLFPNRQGAMFRTTPRRGGEMLVEAGTATRRQP